MAESTEPMNAQLRERMADAWDEGLSAGCDRWCDSREFGDPPVNPYRNANADTGFSYSSSDVNLNVSVSRNA